MVKFDAIFFDVDGTLVDARDDIVNAVNYALNRLGTFARPKDEIVSYIGTGVADLIRKCLGPENIRFLECGIKEFSDYYGAHPADRARLYPHVIETLEHFKDKPKYILTNRYSAFADLTLKALGIRKYFKEIIGGDDENCLKPSACVLDGLLPRLNIKSQNSVIVGDMAIDIMTGKNSGMATCWVTYGLGKKEDVLPLKPDFIVGDIDKLREVIE